MPRSQLLNFLKKYNSDNNLSGSIWGEPAANTVKQALLHSGACIPLISPVKTTIIAEHAQETQLAQSTTVGGKVIDLIFPVSSYLSNQNTTKLVRVNNVTVRSYNGYHIVENRSGLIFDLSSAYAPISLMKPMGQGIELDPIEVGFLMFHDTDPSNYCHFILDVLSRCYLLSLLENKPVLLFPVFLKLGYHEFFFRKLTGLGFLLKFINEDEFCSVNKLYAITLGGRISGHPVLNNNKAAINYLNNFVTITSKIRPGSVLWVSRVNTRRVLEEDIILNRLSAIYDLTVSNLDGLDVEQQANLFNEHQVIVGPHGAAFTNICFQEKSPHTRVLVEIFCKDNGMATYSLLANAKECTHYSYVGDRISTSHPNYPDISVDVNDFVDFFSEIVMRFLHD
jgi:hypothetical protein